MNTLEINTLLRKHPHSRPVFKGVYARNRLPRLLNVPSALVGNTVPDYRMWQHCTSTPTHEGNTTIQPDVHRTNPHMSISWTNIAFIGLTIPFEYKKKDLSCADFIAFFYLIHRCAGHSMTDVTRLLENPVEATGIVQKFVLLLVKHVVWKKKEKKSKNENKEKKRRLMQPL